MRADVRTLGGMTRRGGPESGTIEDSAMSVATLLRKGALALSIAAFACAGSAMAAQTPPPAGTMPVGQPQRVQPVQLKNLDAYVERALKTFDVPGMAVAIVKDGRVEIGRASCRERRAEMGVAGLVTRAIERH